MKTAGMFSESPIRITYFHQARRYLRERDPIAYHTASVKEIEHLANCLLYEDFRRHIQPYQQQKERLLSDFYSWQAMPGQPLPEWLREAIAEWDSMIAIEARKFGLSNSGDCDQS